MIRPIRSVLWFASVVLLLVMMIAAAPSYSQADSGLASPQAIPRSMQLRKRFLRDATLTPLQNDVTNSEDNGRGFLSVASSSIHSVESRSLSSVSAVGDTWLYQTPTKPDDQSLSELRNAIRQYAATSIATTMTPRDIITLKVDPDVAATPNVVEVEKLPNEAFQYGLDQWGRVLIVKGTVPRHTGSSDPGKSVKSYLDVVHLADFATSRDATSMSLPSTAGHIIAASLASTAKDANEHPLNFFLQDGVSNNRGTYYEQERVAQFFNEKLSGCVEITITFSYSSTITKPAVRAATSIGSANQFYTPEGGKYKVSVVRGCAALTVTTLSAFVASLPIVTKRQDVEQLRRATDFIKNAIVATDGAIGVEKQWLNSHVVTNIAVESKEASMSWTPVAFPFTVNNDQPHNFQFAYSANPIELKFQPTASAVPAGWPTHSFRIEHWLGSPGYNSEQKVLSDQPVLDKKPNEHLIKFISNYDGVYQFIVDKKGDVTGFDVECTKSDPSISSPAWEKPHSILLLGGTLSYSMEVAHDILQCRMTTKFSHTMKYGSSHATGLSGVPSAAFPISPGKTDLIADSADGTYTVTVQRWAVENLALHCQLAQHPSQPWEVVPISSFDGSDSNKRFEHDTTVPYKYDECRLAVTFASGKVVFGGGTGCSSISSVTPTTGPASSGPVESTPQSLTPGKVELICVHHNLDARAYQVKITRSLPPLTNKGALSFMDQNNKNLDLSPSIDFKASTYRYVGTASTSITGLKVRSTLNNVPFTLYQVSATGAATKLNSGNLLVKPVLVSPSTTPLAAGKYLLTLDVPDQGTYEFEITLP